MTDVTLSLDSTELEDLSIALELRIIHYWEEFDAAETAGVASR